VYKVPLIPKGFEAPVALEAERFRLRPLNYEVMLADYEAVIKGAGNLARAYEREEAYYRNFTLQDEIIELGWHIGEWRRRRSFAYAVMRPDGGTCYGSVYVYPTMKRDYDAHVILWTVPEAPAGLEGELYAAVRRWLGEAWPFAKVGYPGREMPWADWHALPDQ
jgi:hypothetical protein